MKNTSFLIVSLLASTHVYGVSKSDHLRGSKDVYATIGTFLPADGTMRLMHSNKQLKNKVDKGQTPGGHFHVYQIADRVIAQRMPTTANNTTVQIDLEQFLRDNDIKARQLDLVSPTLDGTTDPMEIPRAILDEMGVITDPNRFLGLRNQTKKNAQLERVLPKMVNGTKDPMTISRAILDEMGVKTLTVKGMLKGDCTDYKGIKVIADTIAMTTDKKSPFLDNIHANLLLLQPKTDIALNVSGCNIDTLFLHPRHKVTMNSDNGIKYVTGDTRGLRLDNTFIANVGSNDSFISPYGEATDLDQEMKKNPNDVTDLGHSGQWQISRYHAYLSRYNDYHDYIIAKTNDVVDSKSFDDLKQFMAQNNITGPFLYLDTPTQDAAMEIPRDMIDTMNFHTVIAKSMLQGDYSNKEVSIEIPNKKVVHLGKIKADTLRLYTGPYTRHVDFTNVNFTQGDDALVHDLYIRPYMYVTPQITLKNNITLDSPLSGAFASVAIESPHDVIITGENNNSQFLRYVKAPKVCVKGTCYEDIIQR